MAASDEAAVLRPLSDLMNSSETKMKVYPSAASGGGD